MALPPTVRESITKYLPALYSHEKKDFKQMKESGKTTKKTEAPFVFLEQSKNDLAEISNQVMQRARNPRLGQITIPSTFTQLDIASETGLINASMLYLMHGILEILNVLFKDNFEVFSEYSYAKGGDNVRVDMMFRKTGTTEIIAIIEFKRPGQFIYKDFQPGILPHDTTKAKIDAMVEHEKWLQGGEQEESVFRRNAHIFSKQVSAYGIMHKCRFVALIEWHHAAFFHFDKLKAGNGTVGETAQVTWVNEGTRDEPSMRTILLGWIYSAFAAKGVVPKA